jgi:hypothetical protein
MPPSYPTLYQREWRLYIQDMISVHKKPLVSCSTTRNISSQGKIQSEGGVLCQHSQPLLSIYPST